MHINSLPTDCLLFIFRYLSLRDLLTTGMVCHLWKGLQEEACQRVCRLVLLIGEDAYALLQESPLAPLEGNGALLNTPKAAYSSTLLEFASHNMDRITSDFLLDTFPNVSHLEIAFRAHDRPDDRNDNGLTEVLKLLEHWSTRLLVLKLIFHIEPTVVESTHASVFSFDSGHRIGSTSRRTTSQLLRLFHRINDMVQLQSLSLQCPCSYLLGSASKVRSIKLPFPRSLRHFHLHTLDTASSFLIAKVNSPPPSTRSSCTSWLLLRLLAKRVGLGKVSLRRGRSKATNRARQPVSQLEQIALGNPLNSSFNSILDLDPTLAEKFVHLNLNWGILQWQLSLLVSYYRSLVSLHLFLSGNLSLRRTCSALQQLPHLVHLSLEVHFPHRRESPEGRPTVSLLTVQTLTLLLTISSHSQLHRYLAPVSLCPNVITVRVLRVTRERCTECMAASARFEGDGPMQAQARCLQAMLQPFRECRKLTAIYTKDYFSNSYRQWEKKDL